MGAGAEIVGVVEYSDFPEAASQFIQTIGNANRINYEQVLALRPSLVIAWQSGNGEESIKRLRELGLQVFSYEPETLDDVAESLRVVGDLSGHTEQGIEQADLFTRRLNLLRSKYSQRQKVSVFYQLGEAPLMTLNGKHLVSDVLLLCGGLNVFSDAVPLVPRVSIESILGLYPEVILGSTNSETHPLWLDEWKKWPSLAAVQKDNLYPVNADFMHRHSPRILDGAEQICEIFDSARIKDL